VCAAPANNASTAAHQVQDDPVLSEQAEIARRGGAVEHARMSHGS
jgi:hypothetical protein